MIARVQVREGQRLAVAHDSHPTLGDVPLLPVEKLDVDLVQMLLEDRQSGR